jgi:hypothetical protein
VVGSALCGGALGSGGSKPIEADVGSHGKYLKSSWIK